MSIVILALSFVIPVLLIPIVVFASIGTNSLAHTVLSSDYSLFQYENFMVRPLMERLRRSLVLVRWLPLRARWLWLGHLVGLAGIPVKSLY